VSIDAVGVAVGRRLYVYYGAGSGLSIASDLKGGIGVRVYEAFNQQARPRGLREP
jgi:hypothetical protein